VRFIVDAQLPPALARFLSAKGHVAEHVSDLQMESCKDLEIWEWARTADAVFVTKDEDFVDLQIRRREPAVVWVRSGNLSRLALLEKFEGALPVILDALSAGEGLVELR
jgi:predicted nuclease of predicted toxin-antitoxin system